MSIPSEYSGFSFDYFFKWENSLWSPQTLHIQFQNNTNLHHLRLLKFSSMRHMKLTSVSYGQIFTVLIALKFLFSI